MAHVDTSLLDGVDIDDEGLKIYQNLLQQAASEKGLTSNQAPAFHRVIPKPGFCLKTRDDKGEKIFLNICHAENVPDAKNITDEELVKLLESEDPTSYRIPMSLGEPHAEVDKSNKGVTVYDIVVNPKFIERVHNSQMLMGFFLTVSLEGIENKYNITLERNWVILKNRKCIGNLAEQNIRKESKPWIMEMDDESLRDETSKKKPLISEVSSKDKPQSKGAEPPYTILKEPPNGPPEFLVAEIHLPKVKTAATMNLDIGEDRILLETRSNIYHLDIFLPYYLMQEECGAQFNRKNKVLTITMPVQPVT